MMIQKLDIEDLCRILRLYKYDIHACRELFVRIKDAGINYFFNYGSRKIYGKLRVVGVGFTGLLLLASAAKGIVLVKILRKDSRRSNMLYECNILKIASKLGVSPRVHSCDNEYIIMEYVDGFNIAEYVENFKELQSIYDLKAILKSIMYKAFLLDKNHIDHGELSRPYKHVLISPKGVFIIDFDSASMSRIPRNFTSVLGGLFFRKNKFSKTIVNILQITNNCLEEVSIMVRNYKKHVNFDIVEEVMKKLRIT